MTSGSYPSFFADRIFSKEDALEQTVKSDSSLASGFATSEPHTFYDGLWDHIQKNDITDLKIRQALFMGPHRLCVGDALQSKGIWADYVSEGKGIFSSVARTANAITKKVEGLGKLIDHYRELEERKITLISPFIGAATNIHIPPNAITRAMFPKYVGRNTTRMGITDMHSIHFPDAVDSIGYDPEGNPKMDTFIVAMTPPNENGDLSNGPANGANQEIIEKILQCKDANLLLYINKKYPFTTGYGDAPNTINVEQMKGLAEAGRLFVVEDDGKVPSLPADSFANPAPTELAIAENIVNHIELNKDYTYGRPIQVGFGSTGILAIKALKDSSWHGRSYTEMLEPFTLDLFDAGKIKGSHFIELDGTRTQLDGKMVCTFTICEENSDFYKRISNNPAVIVSAASRVVISEAFHHGMGINNCLGIDFHGHVNSGGRDRNHHSGVGGGAKIMRGLSKGGVGYMCLKSTHTGPDGELRSSIFPFLPKGTPISHIGPDLMGGRDGARLFVTTEHGVARVSGKSQSEFIKSMIEIADPRFRDWLKHKAYKEFRITF
jgi:acyl-CoA hydrolase